MNIKTLEEFRSAYVRARQDPEWEQARDRYLAVDDSGASPDDKLIARTAAIQDMHRIELAYERDQA